MLSNRQLFLQNVAQTTDEPMLLEIERAEGVHIYDTEGKAYIDLISGISVSNVGHCHPRVVEAVQRQAASYMHTMVYGEFVLSPQAKLANFLTDLLPPSLDTVYFTNSGSEATEGAMKVAKKFTGRSEIISCKKSYHGSTHGSLSILGDEYFKRNYRPLLPDTRLIEYNNMADLECITEKTAAVFMEPIQAESGVTVPSTEYLQAVRQRCTEVGAILVLDEIQTGCGRTGKFFAFEHFDIVPDILLLAKGLGGGMPIGAFISSKEIMDVIKDNPVLGHITTFGGHPVCCAGALAAVQVIEEEKLYERVASGNALLLKELEGHPEIRKITHKGLMMALHVRDFDQVFKTMHYGMKHGVIFDWFLFANDCIRIAPPLIIEEDEIIKACSVIKDALDTLSV